jgi:hypothetical protein
MSRNPKVLGSPSFKAWFAASKVVNGIGQPRVVYHGTASDFGVFDMAKAGQNYGEDERGFFFTGRIETAESAADDATRLPAYRSKYQNQGFGGGRDGDSFDYDYGHDEPYDYTADYHGGQNVMPVYLSLQHPLIIDADFGYGAGAHLENRMPESPAQLIERAKREGYDGIIIRGRYRDFDAISHIHYKSFTSDDRKRELLDGVARRDARKHQTDNYFIAFRPEQIKSAIGNCGAFSAENPDICMSRVPRERAR